MKKVAVPGYAARVGNYISALRAAGMEAVVTLEPAEAAGCGGLLLPGGGDIHPSRFGQADAGSRDIDPALDEIQLTVLDDFVRAGKPVLGVCRGHQVLNVYFGGDLIQDLPTAAAHMAHEGADSVHPAENAPGGLLYRLYGPAMTVNSSHHQGLGALGAGLRAISRAPDGVAEAIEHERLPILGVQFHPERMAYGLARPDTICGAPLFDWLRRQMEQ